MAGLNKATVIGNLGNAPETRTLPNGDLVAVFNVATSDSYLDKSGEKKEIVEWHRCVFFRRQAELAQQYLRKGSKVYVEGKMRKREWQDANTGQSKVGFEIVGSQLIFLDAKPQESKMAPANMPPQAASYSPQAVNYADELPPDYADLDENF